MADGVEIIAGDGFLEIHIDRPEKKNALTAAMYRAMVDALDEAVANDAISAVIFAGKGDSFCAGNDLKDFLSGPEASEAPFAFIAKVATFDKPLIAAVQGLAVGVGTTMLFHCDLVYAAPDARFIMPFVNLGLVPEAASSLLAPATLGRAKAAQMLLLGEPMDATTADAAGLVSAIVPNDDLLAHARAKAAVLSTKPPAALAATRRLLRGDRALIEARIKDEAALFAEAMQSAEAKEAFSAFLEKRVPNFRDLAK